VARQREPIAGERHFELEWQGPFLLRGGELVEHPLEPCSRPGSVGGLYLIHGLNPLSNSSSLLYIGHSANLSKRLEEHDGWLKAEWRVEVYTAAIPDTQLRCELEKLLIYSHQPQYNSRENSSRPNLSTPLRVWNTGRFWGLHPEMSSEHTWCA
jgi:hypothetical protein